jgi:fumarate reductase iron-sulfur subunit
MSEPPYEMVTVEVEIERRRPNGEPHRERFRLEVPRGDHVLSVLAAIRAAHDPTLCYPAHFCKVGTCGACALMIDGVSRLGCRTLVTGPTLHLAPAKGRAVIADLLTASAAPGTGSHPR